MKIILMTLILIFVSGETLAGCYNDEWGRDVCTEDSNSSKNKSLYEHSAETVKEAYDQLFETGEGKPARIDKSYDDFRSTQSSGSATVTK